MVLFPIINIIYTIKTIYSINWSRRLDSCPPFGVNLVLLATLTNILESTTTGIVSDYTRREISCNAMLKSDDLHECICRVASPCTALFGPFYHFVHLQTANGIIMQSPVVFEMKRKRVKSDTIIMRSTSLSFLWNTISKEDIEPTSAHCSVVYFHFTDAPGWIKKITKKKRISNIQPCIYVQDMRINYKLF